MNPPNPQLATAYLAADLEIILNLLDKPYTYLNLSKLSGVKCLRTKLNNWCAENIIQRDLINNVYFYSSLSPAHNRIAKPIKSNSRIISLDSDPSYRAKYNEMCALSRKSQGKYSVSGGSLSNAV